MFTGDRVFILDTLSVSGKKAQFVSIPYRSIEAWNFDTARKPGKAFSVRFTMDFDCELELFTRGLWPLDPPNSDDEVDGVIQQEFMR